MTRRRATLSTIFIALALIFCAYMGYVQFYTPTAPLPSVAPGFYRVTKVSDGDTIVVDMNGVAENVRFIGVDTPETHKPNTPVQCFGPQASDFTTKTLTGASVRLEADPTNDNRDRNDRMLTPASLTSLKEMFKKGRFYICKATGHLMPIEAPQDTATIIRRILAKAV